MFHAKRSRQIRRSALIETLEPRLLLTSVVVNTTLDDNPTGLISLRDAITMANSSATPTTITFSSTVFATAKTITLNGTELELTNTKEATTITGTTAGVTISGNDLSTGVYIDSGVTVAISDLTITKCETDVGAGISNEGTLTLTDSTVLANDATSDDDGGGMANYGTAKLINDTFANNIGDAIDQRGGTLTMFDCTVSGNSSYGSFSGGGIYNQGGTVTVGNSIISGNTEAVKTGSEDVYGAFISKGYNLIGETDGSTGWVSTDLKGTVAKPLSADLGALANNGGPTETFLPLIGSPVINKGSNALIPTGVTTDQRGLARIIDKTVDIGSVEVGATITITPPAAQTANLGVSKSFTLGSFVQSNAVSSFKVSVNWGDGSAVTVLTVGAAGTIPATAHTFTKAATDTVSLSITDADGNVSNTASFKITVTGAVITVTPPANQTALVGTSKSFPLGSFTESNAAEPYKVSINWGDGSTVTVLTMTAAGTIPATAHTFTKAATDKISISIVDADGHTSNTATFSIVVSAPTSTISGEVFDDVNGNGKVDTGELGLGLWTVDLYKGTTLVTTTTTSATGTFSFTGLAAGTYTVKIVQLAGAKSTPPSGGSLTLTLTAGENSTGNLFGEN